VRWQSPLGTVDTDNEILDRIKESGLISLDEENLEKDHAVKTLVPFIKEYFPDAKIVPLLFTSEETMRKDMLLADKLNSLSSDSTFILASLDFSHYLSAAVADEKDKETLDDIQKKDYAAISAFNSDHTDSHWALITLIRTMELENANGPEVIRHMNSAEFPGEDPTYTTSYFSIVYGH
jgi:AmmeMemoRadiSam system protein B